MQNTQQQLSLRTGGPRHFLGKLMMDVSFCYFFTFYSMRARLVKLDIRAGNLRRSIPIGERFTFVHRDGPGWIQASA
jgi:hypothetical protein